MRTPQDYAEKLKMEVLGKINASRQKRCLEPLYYDYFSDKVLERVATDLGQINPAALGIQSYKNRIVFEVLSLCSSITVFEGELDQLCEKNRSVVLSSKINVAVFFVSFNGDSITFKLIFMRSALLLEELDWDLEFLKMRGKSLGGRSVHTLRLSDGFGRCVEVEPAHLVLSSADCSFSAMLHKTALDALLDLSSVSMEIHCKKVSSTRFFVALKLTVDLSTRRLVTSDYQGCSKLHPKNLLSYVDSPANSERKLRLSRSVERIAIRPEKNAGYSPRLPPCSTPNLFYSERKLMEEAPPKKTLYCFVEGKGEGVAGVLRGLQVFALTREEWHNDVSRLKLLEEQVIKAARAKTALTGQIISSFIPAVPAEGFSPFEQLLNSDTHADLVLVVGERERKSHKLVLSASSAFFKKVLGGSGSSVQPKLDFADFPGRAQVEALLHKNSIDLKVDRVVFPFYFCPQALEPFLQFCYTRRLLPQSMSPPAWISLLRFAHHINFTELLGALLQYCSSQTWDIKRELALYVDHLFDLLLALEAEGRSLETKFVSKLLLLQWISVLPNQGHIAKLGAEELEDLLVLSWLADMPSEHIIKELLLKNNVSSFNDYLSMRCSISRNAGLLVFDRENLEKKDLLRGFSEKRNGDKNYIELDLDKHFQPLFCTSAPSSESILSKEEEPGRLSVTLNGWKKSSIIVVETFKIEPFSFNLIIVISSQGDLWLLIFPNESKLGKAYCIECTFFVDFNAKKRSSSLLAVSSSAHIFGSKFELEFAEPDQRLIEISLTAKINLPFSALLGFAARNFNSVNLLESRAGVLDNQNVDFLFSDFTLSLHHLFSLQPIFLFLLLSLDNLNVELENKVFLCLVLYFEEKAESLSETELDLLLLAARFNYIAFNFLLDVSLDNRKMAKTRAFRSLLEDIFKGKNNVLLKQYKPRASYRSTVPTSCPDPFKEFMGWLTNHDVHSECRTTIEDQAQEIAKLTKKLQESDKIVAIKNKNFSAIKKKCESLEREKKIKHEKSFLNSSKFDFVKSICQIF